VFFWVDSQQLSSESYYNRPTRTGMWAGLLVQQLSLPRRSFLQSFPGLLLHLCCTLERRQACRKANLSTTGSDAHTHFVYLRHLLDFA
jgi:hypothetical protein